MSIVVSVVMPTYRRPELLERCLSALVHQDLAPSEYEVIVADDAASEETLRQVERWRLTSRCRIRYVPVTGAHGPAAARNAGWRTARGPIVAFTDDDCVPDRGWLRAGLAAFQDDVAAAWGRLRMPLPPEPTDYERNESNLERAEFVTANCFCRRDVLEAVGGFDERFTAAWREDSDLYFTLLERGYRVVAVPEALVVHPVRPACWGVSLYQQRKSLFNALLYKKHPQLYRSRIQRSPPWSYYVSTVALTVALVAGVSGAFTLWAVAGLLWLVLTARFCLRRLRHTSHAPRHVVEMVVTSVLIPPVAIFWRLCGALRFGVPFL